MPARLKFDALAPNKAGKRSTLRLAQVSASVSMPIRTDMGPLRVRSPRWVSRPTSKTCRKAAVRSLSPMLCIGATGGPPGGKGGAAGGTRASRSVRKSAAPVAERDLCSAMRRR